MPAPLDPHRRCGNGSTHAYAQRSLVSVLVTSLLTTVHHFYRFGWLTVVLGAITLGLPTVLLLWFRETRKPAALAGYGIVSAWIIVGFGLIDGLWGSTLKLFLGNFLLARYGQYFSWAPVGSFAFEATGILASIASLFAAYYLFRFLRSAHGDLTRFGGVLPMRWLAGGALVLLFIGGSYAAFAFHAGDAALPEGSIIKIGVIVPTKGPGALLGTSFLKAVQLAREELGSTKYRYELVIADGGTNPVQAKASITRLIEEDGVQAIIGGISLLGQVVQPYATYAQIPHVCVCSVASIGDGGYNFTNIPLPQDEAKRWVAEAKRRGIKTVALLTQDYPSIDGHVRALQEEMGKEGLRTTYANRFAGTTTDFRSMIATARKADPDVYFVEATNPALDLLGRQLKDADIHAISSIVALSISDDPALFEGAWYTDSHLADPAFKARFEERYPDTRFATHMMPYAYDSLKMLVQGFESGQDVAVFLRETAAYDGTSGRITKEPGTGNFRSTPAVWIIEDGRLRLL